MTVYVEFVHGYFMRYIFKEENRYNECTGRKFRKKHGKTYC